MYHEGWFNLYELSCSGGDTMDDSMWGMVTWLNLLVKMTRWIFGSIKDDSTFHFTLVEVWCSLVLGDGTNSQYMKTYIGAHLLGRK